MTRYRLKKRVLSSQTITAIKWCAITTLLVFISGLALLFYYTPPLDDLHKEFRKPAVIIKDQHHNVLAVYGDYFTHIVHLDKMPTYVPHAFLAIEDHNFYKHCGVNFRSVLRAFFKNKIAGKIVEGGSTLTQQLAKQILIGNNYFNYKNRSYIRKLQELFLAFQLEIKFSKNEILTLYLNRVYFGSGTYGIDAAALHYFQKSASQLTLFEAAILAGLLKAPSKYSPHNNQVLCLQRAKMVLKLMQEREYIDDAETFFNDKIDFHLPNRNLRFFTDWIYDFVGLCIDKEQTEDIEVITTFDLALQTKALRVCKRIMETEGTRLNAKEIALVIMNPHGAVRAMIGGINHSVSQFNRVTQAQRQAGSVIKPLIFFTALENGFSMNDYIDDSPFEIESESESWKPSNFRWKAIGSITLLDALVNSVNAVPIRLAQTLGIKRIHQTLKKMGIYTKQPDDLTIALGSGDVNLMDLTAAYASFTNEGCLPSPYGVTVIKNKKGEILYEHLEDRGKKIMSDESLAQMRTALNEIVQRGTGRRAQIERQISGKTGSNKNSDAWFIGYYEEPQKLDDDFCERDHDVAFGIWVGNDNPHDEMKPQSRGGIIPAMIAKEIFTH